MQRNFSTTLSNETLTEHKPNYVTVPERLKDFQDRIQSYLDDDWRLFAFYPEQVNNATCAVCVLVRG